MPSAAASSSRALMGVVWASALAAFFSGCGEQSLERRGGSELPDLNGGDAPVVAAGAGNAGGGGQTSESGSAGVAESGAAGDAGMAGAAGAAGALVTGGPVKWCDAYRVINCVCQQCHQDPTLNGAAMPLMTYENTQVGFPHPTSAPVWKRMQTVVTSNFMPYMGDATVMPPVKPLTSEQKDTLLTWLMEGAHDEGGTGCANACDWSDGTPEL